MQDTRQAIDCLETRAAMREYLRHQVLPFRRRRIEDHLVGCSGCIREFVELRESHWMSCAAVAGGLAAA
jgi:predicted anti-sigma-YlaC factor YlaD